MSMMGNLSDVSLEDLLFLFSIRRRSGNLILQARGDEVQLQLLKGRVVLVTSSNSGLRLGRTLLRLGYIPHEQLRDALQEQEQTVERRSLGSILTDRRWISPGDLAYCVEDHAIAVLARIIDTEEGSFVFARTEGSRPRYPLNIAADRLIIEATRRWDEIATLKTLLPPVDHHLMIGPHHGLYAATLDPSEKAVVNTVARTEGTVASVIDNLMTVDEIAAWRTIISLQERGVLCAVPVQSLAID